MTLRRDIGVVHVVEGYRGTIAALWGLKAAAGEHWPADASRSYASLGITSDGLHAFRRQVEQSDVFSALLSSRIAELTVMAYYA